MAASASRARLAATRFTMSDGAGLPQYLDRGLASERARRAVERDGSCRTWRRRIALQISWRPGMGYRPRVNDPDLGRRPRIAW
jgi:hypothetical protein